MNTALTWLKHVSKYIKFVLNQCMTFHKLGCFKARLVYKMSRFLRQKMSTITAIINPVTQRVMRDPCMFVHLRRVCLKVDFFLFNATHGFLEI